MFDQSIQLVLRGTTIALFSLAYKVEVFECSSGQLNALDRDLDAVDCGGVQQDGSNESEINRESCRSSALRSSLSSELDQFLAGDVFKSHAPEGPLERFKDHGFQAPNRLANLGKVVEMQRDQIGKDSRLLVGPGASDRRASID